MKKIWIGLLALVVGVGGYNIIADQNSDVAMTKYETIVVENEPIVEEAIVEEAIVEEAIVEEVDAAPIDDVSEASETIELNPDEEEETELVESTEEESTEEESSSEEKQVAEAETVVETTETEKAVNTPVVQEEPVAVTEPVAQEPVVEVEELTVENTEDLVEEEVVEVVEEETPATGDPLSVPEDGIIRGQTVSEIAAKTPDELKAEAIGLILSKLSSDEISRFKGYLDEGINDAERADIMSVFHSKFSASEQEWVWSVYNEVVVGN